MSDRPPSPPEGAAGGARGEMVARLRSFDWAKTPLGAMGGWPQALKVAVGICLNSRFPMFVWWGPDLVNIYNDAYIPILGKRHPHALGRPARSIWGEIWDVVGPQAEAVMVRGEATWNERVLLVMERNGYVEDTWFTWSYSPILDGAGGIGGLFCACTEDTPRVLVEAQRDRLLAQLDTERSRLAEMFHRSPSFIAVVRGPDHVFELTNERYAELIGRRDVVGRPVREALPELEGQGFFELLDRVYASGEPFVGQGTTIRLQRRPGGPLEERYLEFVYQPTRDGNGAVNGIFCHGNDLTGRRRVEEALRSSEERLAQAVSIAQLGTFDIDLRTDAVTVNEAGRAVYGWAPGEALTFSKVQAHFHPDDKAYVMREVGLAFDPAGPGEFEVEQRIVRADGETRWIRVRGRALFDGAGAGRRAVRCIGTYLDVTDHKEAEHQREELLARERAARAEAERASEAKSQFLATLSHELRTPLTPVLLTVSLMEMHPGLPEDLRADVATIRRNVELESQLIADLLDLTRITSGKLQLDVRDVDLHAVVRSAIDICQREASARLEVDLAARRHVVRGDPTRLQQIFWNVVSNAAKFTGPHGLITVRSSDAPGGRVRVEVADTGAGIDPSVLPKLFAAFEQGDVRTGRQQAGLGLGLAISRRLTEAHGGTITAHSEGRGRGATFTVELLAAEAAAPRPDEPGERPATGAGRSMHVLVVEDHEPTLHVMSKLLRGLGHRVTGASTVAAAAAAARQNGFDLIISDLGLPDGSGLDVMRQVRERYACRAIALTGYGMESDIAASREAGFAEHLTKPVDLAALDAAIRRVGGAGASD